MVETRNLHDVLRNKSYISDIKKKTKTNYGRIFSLAWNIVYWLLKSHCFEFFGCGKYGLFWAKKLMEIDMYWLLKALDLDFSGMGNTVFFWDKKLIKRWCLLITDMFLFWTFRGRKIRSFFEAKSWWKDDIYQLLKSSCFELFHDGKCGLIWDKKLVERWYLLITEKFMFWATEKFLFWAFRWWEIRSFF